MALIREQAYDNYDTGSYILFWIVCSLWTTYMHMNNTGNYDGD